MLIHDVANSLRLRVSHVEQVRLLRPKSRGDNNVWPTYHGQDASQMKQFSTPAFHCAHVNNMFVLFVCLIYEAKDPVPAVPAYLYRATAC